MDPSVMQNTEHPAFLFGASLGICLQCRRSGLDPWLGRPLGEGNGNRSSILAWRIPWTEEPGQLETTGLQRVRHNWAINTFIFTYTQNPYTANSYTHACLYKHTCTYWTPGTDSRPPVNLKSIKCWLMLKPLRLFFSFFFFWPRPWILFPWPQLKLMTPAVEARTLNH